MKNGEIGGRGFLLRNQLPETSESEPGVGLASTLCLDPWQHSLHLLHIVPGNKIDVNVP